MNSRTALFSLLLVTSFLAIGWGNDSASSTSTSQPQSSDNDNFLPKSAQVLGVDIQATANVPDVIQHAAKILDQYPDNNEEDAEDTLLVASGGQVLQEVLAANTGYKIGFTSQENIFIMNPDGTDVTQLTAADGPAGYVSWGPQGQYLYYAAAHAGPEAAWEAYRVDVESGEATQLTEFGNDVRSLGVSPDGLTLAISVMSGNSNIGNNNDNLTQFHTDLYVIEMIIAELIWAKGGKLRLEHLTKLVSSPAEEQFWYEELNWNPVIPTDGNAPILAYTKTYRYDDDANSYTHAYTIRADGTEQTLLAENQDAPIWDFTGTRLGFLGMQYYDFTTNSIAAISVQGITREVAGPAFSPDGNFVLFEVGDENRQAGIARFAKGTVSTGVVLDVQNVYEPRWSPVSFDD